MPVTTCVARVKRQGCRETVKAWTVSRFSFPFPVSDTVSSDPVKENGPTSDLAMYARTGWLLCVGRHTYHIFHIKVHTYCKTVYSYIKYMIDVITARRETNPRRCDWVTRTSRKPLSFPTTLDLLAIWVCFRCLGSRRCCPSR